MRIRTARRPVSSAAADAHTATAAGPNRPLPPRRAQRRWLGPLAVLIGMIVLADALIGEQSLSSSLRSRREYAAVGAEVSALRDENNRLRAQIRRLREDPEAIEFVARKDLGLARPGEILVVLK